MDTYIRRDPKDKSTQPKAINPRIRVEKSEDNGECLDGEDSGKVASDKIDPFGENPGWDPMWVKAFKINFLGKTINLAVFGVFNIVFWGIALNHYYKEINIFDIKPAALDK